MVSVIMPSHNDERYVRTAIQSVLSQTFTEWELIVVDDCSRDHTPEIIDEFCQIDSRVRKFATEQPSGSPTLPRNIGIKNAQGRYIAFLDSDDKWMPTKLEHQIDLFQKVDDAVIVFSNYKKMDDAGQPHKRNVTAPAFTDYHRLLKGNVMGCLTIMYDSEKVGKLFFPSCGHEDYSLWLTILKSGGKAYNTNSIEAFYRIKSTSVSSNKFRAMGWQWYIYTKVEKLGFLKSAYFFVNYAVRAVIKRLK